MKSVRVQLLPFILILAQICGLASALQSSPTNTPPTIAHDGDVVAYEDVYPAWISYIVNDAESELQLLQVTAHSSNQGLLPDENIQVTRAGISGIIRLVPLTNMFGTTFITLTVTDPQGDSSSTVCQFTVLPVNDLPTLDALGDLTINEDAGLQVVPLSGITSGATNELQTLMVSAVASPSGILTSLRIDYASPNRTGTLSFGTVSNATGTALVTVLVDDGESFYNVTTRSFIVRVLPLNDPPMISPLAGQVVDEDTLLGPVALQVADLETAAGNLVLSASSSNPTLVPQSGIIFGGSGSNRTVRVLPGTNQFGSAVITVRVRDEGGLESSGSFGLTVRPVNDPPFISALGDLATDEDVPKDISFVVGDVESRAEDLLISGTSSNPGLVSGLVFSGAGSNRVLTVVPAPNQFGRATITLEARDGEGGVSRRSFELVVNAVNHAPTLDPISAITIDEDAGAQVINLTGISSGSTNENQDLVITAFSSEPGLIPDPVVNYVNPSSTGRLTFAPVANANGVATIVVQVDDRQSLNNLYSQSFRVTVRSINDLPTISTVADQVTEEDVPTRPVLVSLADVETPGSALVLSAHSSNAVLAPDANIILGGIGGARTVMLIPARGQFGAAGITLTVTDADGGSASSAFLFTVSAVNNPPTLDPIANITIPENALPQTVPLTGLGSGAPNENQALVVTANSSKPGLISQPLVTYTSPNTTGSLLLTPVTGASGAAIITVAVNDGTSSNNITTRSFSVTVLHTNRAPVISALLDKVIGENSVAGPIPFAISDQETPAANLLLTASSSNPALVPNSNLLLEGAGSNRTLTVFPAALQSGSATITLRVSDGLATASSSFLLTVQAVNQPPTLDPLAPLFLKSNPGDVSVSLTGISSGASNEVQALSVSVSTSDSSFYSTQPFVTYTSPNSSAILSFKPDKRALGTNRLNITVDDHGSANNLFSQALLVCIRPNGNTPPAASGIFDQTILENTSTAPIPFTVQDAETAAGSLTLAAFSSNPVLVPPANIRFGGSGNNRTVMLIAATNQTGSALITLSVTDANYGGTNVSFMLTVNPVNQPPMISALPNQTIAEDASTGLVPFNIGDPETSAESLSLSATSSNSGLVPQTGIVLNGTGRNRTLAVQPAAHQSGSATITITVTDLQGATASSAFLLTVTPTNYPPGISGVADQTIAEDTSTGAIPFTVQDTETPAANLVVRASSSNGALLPLANIVLAGSGTNRTVVLSPALNQFGTAVITLTVTDSAGASASNHFVLTVTPVNDLPVIGPVANQVTDENVPTPDISFTISDLESAAENLLLSASSSNIGLVQDNAIYLGGTGSNRTVRLIPATNQFGSAAITLLVIDEQGGVASRTFGLTVNPVNHPPTLSAIADQVIDEDSQTGTIPFVVRDIETPASGLLLSAESSNPGLIPQGRIQFAGSGMNRVVTLRPATNQFGSARITITVTDGAGASASSSFGVTVHRVNYPPAISTIARQVTTEDTPTPPIGFVVGDLETPASNLVVSVQSSNPVLAPPGGLVLGGSESNRTLTITPAAHQYGTAVITLTVTDADGGQASNSFSLTVTQTSFPPVITAQPQGQTITIGATATLSVTVSVSAMSSALEPLSYQWQRNGLALVGQTNASLVLAKVEPPDAGEYKVVVSNYRGAVTSDPAPLRVLAPSMITRILRANGVAVISFTTLPGLIYTVESKENLDDPAWNVLDIRSGTGDVLELQDFGAKIPSLFYRVRVE